MSLILPRAGRTPPPPPPLMKNPACTPVYLATNLLLFLKKKDARRERAIQRRGQKISKGGGTQRIFRFGGAAGVLKT